MAIRSRRGFTLIELMLVVMIIGVLASIAMPELNGTIERTKESERATDLRSLLTTVVTEVRTGTDLSVCPDASTFDITVDRSDVDWDPPGPSGPMAAFVPNKTECWQRIEWSLDSGTHFRFHVAITDLSTPHCSGGDCARVYAIVTAMGDLNLDGTESYKEFACFVGERSACLPGSLFLAGGDPTEVKAGAWNFGQETDI